MSRKLSSRRFLRTVLGGTARLGRAAFGGIGYTTQIGSYALDVTRLTIPLPHLSPVFDGMTIAQISDLHFGNWMTLERALDIAAAVNALEPDLVAITGDLISVIREGTFSKITQTLRALRAREGVVVVLGNHDHKIDATGVSRAIRDADVWLLLNQNRAIRRGNAALFIAGVDDIRKGKHDLDAALAGIPSDSATILLAHEPDFADEVAATGRVGLQLSGHTHGGQIRLPFIGAPILPYLGRKYDQGRYAIDGMTLYVNRGVGMIPPYVRFNCGPEITYITLTAGA